MRTAIGFVLLCLSLWDLYQQRVPVIMLLLLTILSAVVWVGLSGMEKLVSTWSAILTAGVGILLAKRKQLGSADIWVMISLALCGSPDQYWNSMLWAALLLGLVSTGVWWCTADWKQQIPMIPFLLLGSWM